MASVTNPTPESRQGDGSADLHERTSVPGETLLGWLETMLLIREFEVRTMQAYQQRKIGGFCHIYIGQEAVAVGCTSAVEASDPIVTAYRDHGHALARGMDPKHCMAEMFGRIGGCAKGKGGSMHMFDKPHNLYGGHGIVGAQTPLGAGLAFADKYIHEVVEGGASRGATLCFLGDGALNQGSFHEAMNLAGLFDIPVIYVVENNGYSMGTSIGRGTTMSHQLVSKALGYGILGFEVNGMDVIEVHEQMSAIVERCREASRPAFVDMQTYRFKGHSMSDPRKYRTRDEEHEWEAGDPITRLREVLIAAGHLDTAGFKERVSMVRDSVKEAIEWADASPEPDASELYHDVFFEKMGPYTGSSLPEMVIEAEEADAEVADAEVTDAEEDES
jgi:pyruvate dehydrogenase E1 component alpha subunit